jgi:hypothetical protein
MSELVYLLLPDLKGPSRIKQVIGNSGSDSIKTKKGIIEHFLETKNGNLSLDLLLFFPISFVLL